MKTNNACLLIALTILTTSTILEAKTINPPASTTGTTVVVPPTLKTGRWEITYYQGPNENTASSLSTICVNKGNTWSLGLTTTPVSGTGTTVIGGITVGPVGGIIIPGNGGWSQKGNNIQFYGTVGEAIQGAAFSAFGNLTGDQLVTGRYVF